MNVDTRFHQTVVATDDQIWQCHAPILGFERDRQYLWLPHPLDGSTSPFGVFQSVQHKHVAFTVIRLQVTGEPNGLPEYLEAYGLTGTPSSWLWLALCITDSDGRPTTANLRSPLIFHRTTQRGGQIVLDNPQLSIYSMVTDQDVHTLAI